MADSPRRFCQHASGVLKPSYLVYESVLVCVYMFNTAVMLDVAKLIADQFTTDTRPLVQSLTFLIYVQRNIFVMRQL